MILELDEKESFLLLNACDGLLKRDGLKNSLAIVTLALKIQKLVDKSEGDSNGINRENT